MVQNCVGTEQPVAFKIFPSHLRMPVLEKMLASVLPVFVFRNLLDSYIPTKIVMHTGVWASQNTSTKLVAFDEEGFVRDGLSVLRFMRSFLGTCFARNHLYLRYDY